MSKQLSSAYKFSKAFKDGISKNVIATMLITATFIANELNSENFLYFFFLTAGYVIFDRLVRLLEVPKLLQLDKQMLTSEVVKNEEAFRYRALMSILRIKEQKSKVMGRVALQNLKDVDMVKAMVGDLDLLQDDVETIITDQIDIPFKEFLLKDENVPKAPKNVVASVEAKFKSLEILDEE